MVSFALHVVVACVAVVALGAALYMQGFLLDTIAPSPALVVPLAVCLTVAVCASAALVVMQLRAFGGAVARVTVLFCVALWGFSFLLLHWFRYVAAGGGSSAAFHALLVLVVYSIDWAHTLAYIMETSSLVTRTGLFALLVLVAVCATVPAALLPLRLGHDATLEALVVMCMRVLHSVTARPRESLGARVLLALFDPVMIGAQATIIALSELVANRSDFAAIIEALIQCTSAAIVLESTVSFCLFARAAARVAAQSTAPVNADTDSFESTTHRPTHFLGDNGDDDAGPLITYHFKRTDDE